MKPAATEKRYVCGKIFNPILAADQQPADFAQAIKVAVNNSRYLWGLFIHLSLKCCIDEIAC
uniref:Uncharacterized protein n=1 Tax=Anguilla anguilla TaxID=7936 RepID=A0A0E9SHF9_ANGAN